MGIDLWVRAIKTDQAEFLKSNPEKVDYFFRGPDIEFEKRKKGFFSFFQKSKKQNFMQKLVWGSRRGESINLDGIEFPNDWQPPKREEIADLDRKNDEAFHYVFTGKYYWDELWDEENTEAKSIFCYLWEGGEPLIGEDEVLFLMDEKRVKKLKIEIDKIDAEEFKKRLSRDEGKHYNLEEIDYYLKYYLEFERLVNLANERNMAIVFHYLV